MDSGSARRRCAVCVVGTRRAAPPPRADFTRRPYVHASLPRKGSRRPCRPHARACGHASARAPCWSRRAPPACWLTARACAAARGLWQPRRAAAAHGAQRRPHTRRHSTTVPAANYHAAPAAAARLRSGLQPRRPRACATTAACDGITAAVSGSAGGHAGMTLQVRNATSHTAKCVTMRVSASSAGTAARAARNHASAERPRATAERRVCGTDVGACKAATAVRTREPPRPHRPRSPSSCATRVRARCTALLRTCLLLHPHQRRRGIRAGAWRRMPLPAHATRAAVQINARERPKQGRALTANDATTWLSTWRGHHKRRCACSSREAETRAHTTQQAAARPVLRRDDATDRPRGHDHLIK
jgi:hypothetical protein